MQLATPNALSSFKVYTNNTMLIHHLYIFCYHLFPQNTYCGYYAVDMLKNLLLHKQKDVGVHRVTKIVWLCSVLLFTHMTLP